ncbi:hypothetical protein [Peptoniphilus harei]|uniref:hypothetical protein n=1 Tax=Peptoniphilus harei TaxID=54005 RepID=UPI002113D2DD|nr:hypothetical protein [Peptoniphilus harei]
MFHFLVVWIISFLHCHGDHGAFDVMKRDFDKKEILKLATKMEGHPDNVAPAILAMLWHQS